MKPAAYVRCSLLAASLLFLGCSNKRRSRRSRRPRRTLRTQRELVAKGGIGRKGKKLATDVLENLREMLGRDVAALKSGLPDAAKELRFLFRRPDRKGRRRRARCRWTGNGSRCALTYPDLRNTASEKHALVSSRVLRDAEGTSAA